MISYNATIKALKYVKYALNIKIYYAIFDFIKIKGAYSSKNLVALIYKRAKKLSILYKIINIIRDNAFNNNTCACHLHKMLSYSYNNLLNSILVSIAKWSEYITHNSTPKVIYLIMCVPC